MILIFITALEVFSFLAVPVYNLLIEGYSWEDVKQRVYETKLNAVIDIKKEVYGQFDPINLVRHVPYTYYGNGHLQINRHGFIGNRHDQNGEPQTHHLDLFPEKPNNLFRIILIGGSSTAGSGSNSAEETISSQLETLLNKNKPNEKYDYQVLNFGAAGGYTGLERTKFFNELIYYYPDMVIALDGFNDAWASFVEPERMRLDHPIINWDSLSYQYFELMNGHSDYNLYPPKIFKNTFLFVQKVLNKLIKNSKQKEKERLALYKLLPFFKYSEEVHEKFPYFSNVVSNNLEAIASYSSLNNIYFLAYLQPHAFSGKNLSEEEVKKTEALFKNYENKPDSVFNKEKYSKSIHEAFNSYSLVYENLGKKYANYKNIKFFNIISLFDNVKESVFVDTIHSNSLGNKLIAQRYHEDITKTLKQ